jgi:hypothetical protein
MTSVSKRCRAGGKGNCLILAKLTCSLMRRAHRSLVCEQTASVRGDRNGTQRDGQRRLHLRIRGEMGLAERTGMEWNRSPMLRKQQLMNAKTSQSLLPCEGVDSRSAYYNRIASRPYHVLLRHGLMLLWTMSFMLILQQRDDTASTACARARPSLVLPTQTWYILYFECAIPGPSNVVQGYLTSM